MSEIDSAIMNLGQEAYGACVICHGANGEGMPYIGPPLAGSEWVLGPAENIIRLQFRGLSGPITVKGQEWNSAMAPNAPALVTDEKIAAVITYVRNSWGNEASAVTPEEVAKFRPELGKPMLKVEDLIDPLSGEVEEAPAPEATEGVVAEPANHDDHAEDTPAHNDHAEDTPAEAHHAGGGHADEHADSHEASEESHAEHHEEVAVAKSYEEYSPKVSLLGVGFAVWVVVCLSVAVIGGLKNRK